MNNIKQIGTAHFMYINDTDKTMPYQEPTETYDLWMKKLIAGDAFVNKVRVCPVAPEQNPWRQRSPLLDGFGMVDQNWQWVYGSTNYQGSYALNGWFYSGLNDANKEFGRESSIQVPWFSPMSELLSEHETSFLTIERLFCYNFYKGQQTKHVRYVTLAKAAQSSWNAGQQAGIRARPASGEGASPPGRARHRRQDEVAVELLSAALIHRQAAEVNLRIWQSLSAREQQITALICLNYTNRQIAAHLVISIETVKSHVRRVLHKFNLHSKAELRQALAEWDFSEWQ